ncbi:MAG: regulatory protein GntR [Gemmatimonadetes bacterium]|nr:regulatory protein GntR [Gemmatimonadota bacterium]
MSDQRSDIADVLRGRILRALHARALEAGSRLPSARELAADFKVDYRIILDAYRELENEGLIEMRARGGIYVARDRRTDRVPVPSAKWLSDVVGQAIAREIPLEEIAEWVQRAVSTVRLRAAVIQSTSDQIEGMCRELQDDYGIETTGVNISELQGEELPPAVRHADLLLSTRAHEAALRPIAERTGATLIVTDVRADLVGGEWRLLLKRPVFVVVSDERFAETVRHFFAETPGHEHITLLVAGRDDVSVIPEGAPVYVTRSARQQLAGAQLRGRILPTARMFEAEASRQIVSFIVSRNLDALSAMRPPRDD